jgi:hypothetical protein
MVQDILILSRLTRHSGRGKSCSPAYSLVSHARIGDACVTGVPLFVDGSMTDYPSFAHGGQLALARRAWGSP